MRSQRSTIEGRAERAAFTGLLLTAMVAGTIVTIAFGVLSRFLIEDLDISRARVGGLVTAVAVTAAVASPFGGRLTDRIGGRKALFLLFSLSTLGLLSVALAPLYGLLLLAAALAGLAQATANPATNKLIAHHVREGGRGLITGIKQSGVQAGLFVGGLLLPVGAIALGWRATLGLVALVPATALVLTRFVVPPDGDSRKDSSHAGRSRTPETVWWLAGYSLIMGVAAGALLTFLPLYLQEDFGMTVTRAGVVVAVFGLVAMIVRIVSGSVAERIGSFQGVLGSLAATAAVAALLLLIAPNAGNAVLWAGVLLAAASSTTWNSVAMLAVIDHSGPAMAGRSSGIVVLGFLSGFGIGPLLFGYSVDTAGSYAPGLWGIAALFVAASVVAAVWSGRNRRVAAALKGAVPEGG